MLDFKMQIVHNERDSCLCSASGSLVPRTQSRNALSCGLLLDWAELTENHCRHFTRRKMQVTILRRCFCLPTPEIQNRKRVVLRGSVDLAAETNCCGNGAVLPSGKVAGESWHFHIDPAIPKTGFLPTKNTNCYRNGCVCQPEARWRNYQNRLFF